MTSAHKFSGHIEGLTGCFIAGGAVTSTYTNKPISDIDVYPKSYSDLEGAIQWAFDAGLWCVFASERALTFAHKESEDPNVQIMTFDEFPTAEYIFQAFDFTCCMGAYDVDEKKFLLHEHFLLHCAQRFLSFNPDTRFPYASAWRVRKYEEKGFTIGKMEFHKILMACAEKPIRSWEDLKEQIGGVYGEAFDIPEDEPFSMRAAHAAMSTLRPVAPTSPFSTPEEAIILTSSVEREYFETEHAGIFTTWVKIDGEFSPFSCKPRIGKKVNPFEGVRFFKKVVRIDGDSYHSHYKRDFIYRIGEMVESPSPFIWVVSSIKGAKNYSIWSGNKDWAVIELKPEPQDIVWDGSHLKVKKALVLREHRSEEKDAA